MESLNTELWKNPIWISPAKFQTLGVWFIVSRAYMLLKFSMDTEQIVANATNIFWMYSFISGHKKKLNIYSETMFPSHTLQCSLPVNIRRDNHIAVALWLTARAPPATSRGDSVVLPLIRRKVPRDVHKCTTIHIVYRIANPIYHNTRTIITQITYCTDCHMQRSWYM